MRVKLKPCDGDCDDTPKHIWKQHEGRRYCRRCWNKIKPTVSPSGNVSPSKQRTPIAKRSDKKIKQDALYTVLRIQFLKNHPMCQAKAVSECLHKSDQIHHMAGKIGDLYLDDSKFLAVCGPCHRRITDFPKEAIENGWSLLRLTNEE